MALSRISDDGGSTRQSPTESVQQYRSLVLGGPGGSTPQPRTVLSQSGTPKVPYAAKTGSGAMPTTEASGIFALMPTTSGAVRRPKPKPVQQGRSASPSGGGGGYRGNGGGDRSGAYGLNSEAGAHLQALQGAYKAQFGTNLPVNSGGRSYADQVAAYNNYLRGGNLAAKPGTSVHEKGRAVDFGGAANSYSPQHTWLVNNAPRFGWTWAGKNFSQVEPWHFEFQG